MIHLLAVLAIAMAPIPQRAAPGVTDACLRGPFHGITATNEIGEIIGPIDRHDWGCLGDRSRGSVRQVITPDGVPAPPPTDVCLKEAFPNPATTATRLLFTLPQATSATLVIYGRLGGGPKRVIVVRTLMDGAFVAGTHEVLWDLKDDNGVRVPAGIYRAVLAVNGSSLCGDIEVR